jgi:long-chain acyl-CoA synthetase
MRGAGRADEEETMRGEALAVEASRPDEGGPRAVRYASTPGMPAEGTLVELFLRAVDEFDKPDAMLFRSADGWSAISHREVLERVRLIAQGLAGFGVRRGDPVALLSENRPEWALTDYALLCSGAMTVPIYPTLPANQIAFIIRDAGISIALVSTAEQLAKMLEVRAQVATLRTIITFDDVASDAAGVLSMSELLERGRSRPGAENEFRRTALEARPGDVATLIYTSGTTGTPKGVMLTHGNLHSNVHASGVALAVGPADVALSFLPLSHVFQRLVDYVMFTRGTTIAYVPALDAVSQAFREVRPTFAAAVPRVYEKLYARILSVTGPKRRLVLWARRVAIDWATATLERGGAGALLRIRHAIADRLVYGKIRAQLGGNVRCFISGSAPLSPEIHRFFYGAGLVILEGYGLTETSPVTNVNTPDAMRIGTVGRPVPGTEITIADDGEILVRGPQVMKGYYNNPQATAEAIDPDGWLHTGDIGELDADGFLRITDRKKELIKTAGGKFVAPQPVQNACKRSRFIAECVLIGDRRPYPVLIVVPNFDTLESWARQQGITWSDREQLVRDAGVLARLEQEVAQRVEPFARYEKPKRVLAIAREFSIEDGEVTPTLKVRRRVIESRLADRIEALYAEPAPADRA